MMSGSPALAVVVPLEHGEICYPKKAEVSCGIANLRKSSMFGRVLLTQCNAEQAGSRVNRMIVLLDLRFHSACGLMLSRLAIAGHDYNQIVGFGAGLLPDLGGSIGEVFLQPLEVLEQFRAAPRGEQRLDVIAFFS